MIKKLFFVFTVCVFLVSCNRQKNEIETTKETASDEIPIVDATVSNIEEPIKEIATTEVIPEDKTEPSNLPGFFGIEFGASESIVSKKMKEKGWKGNGMYNGGEYAGLSSIKFISFEYYNNKFYYALVSSYDRSELAEIEKEIVKKYNLHEVYSSKTKRIYEDDNKNTLEYSDYKGTSLPDGNLVFKCYSIEQEKKAAENAGREKEMQERKTKLQEGVNDL